jgi:hypothetical protein
MKEAAGMKEATLMNKAAGMKEAAGMKVRKCSLMGGTRRAPFIESP